MDAAEKGILLIFEIIRIMIAQITGIEDVVTGH